MNSKGSVTRICPRCRDWRRFTRTGFFVAIRTWEFLRCPSCKVYVLHPDPVPPPKEIP